MNIEPFHIFLFIHIVSFIIGFGAVIVIDTFGMLWIAKKVKLSQVNFVANTTQKLIWVGWFSLVASGLCLLFIKSNGYNFDLIDSLTRLKVFFVALLGLNGIFLHFIKKSTEHLTDDMEMPKLARFRVTLASTISQMGWWGALIIGFTHRQIEGFIPWPASPVPIMIAILLAIGLVALIGEKLLRPKVAKTPETQPQTNI